MNYKLLNVALAGYGVKRHHTMPYLQTEETVGHHTACVLALVFCLTDEAPSLSLVAAALYHDIGEAVTGDIPATAKWDFPALRKAANAAEQEVVEATGVALPHLTAEEENILKFADMLSYFIKANAEMHAGNGHMLPNARNAHEACLEMIGHLPNSAFDLFHHIMKGIKDVGQC